MPAARRMGATPGVCSRECGRPCLGNEIQTLTCAPSQGTGATLGAHCARGCASMRIAVRRDVCVYNEALSFVITSEQACGKHKVTRGRNAIRARAEGAYMIVQIAQDDPINV